jgi:hypothetical protein
MCQADIGDTINQLRHITMSAIVLLAAEDVVELQVQKESGTEITHNIVHSTITAVVV